MVEASNEIWDCIALKITSFYVGLVNILSFEKDMSHKIMLKMVSFTTQNLQMRSCHWVV